VATDSRADTAVSGHRRTGPCLLHRTGGASDKVSNMVATMGGQQTARPVAKDFNKDLVRLRGVPRPDSKRAQPRMSSRRTAMRRRGPTRNTRRAQQRKCKCKQQAWHKMRLACRRSDSAATAIWRGRLRWDSPCSSRIRLRFRTGSRWCSRSKRRRRRLVRLEPTARTCASRCKACKA